VSYRAPPFLFLVAGSLELPRFPGPLRNWPAIQWGQPILGPGFGIGLLGGHCKIRLTKVGEGVHSVMQTMVKCPR